jgi:hypothetical protein
MCNPPRKSGLDQKRGIPPIELVRSRLNGVKQIAPNHWSARCPAHDDAHPSLGVSVGDDGRVLLICRSRGCGAADICKAMGLAQSDLFRSQNGKPKSESSRSMITSMPTANGSTK